MSIFELYNQLELECKENKDSNLKLKNHSNLITNLPLDHTEVIYLLIIHYNLKERYRLVNDKNKISLDLWIKEQLSVKEVSPNLLNPYGLKKISTKGLIVTIENLPGLLQDIISRYVSLLLIN